MDKSSQPETFCYEKRCEYNFMDKWCMSYRDIKLKPISQSQHAPYLVGYLKCEDFKLKTKKKKKISTHSVGFVTPQAITKNAIKLLTEKEYK